MSSYAKLLFYNSNLDLIGSLQSPTTPIAWSVTRVTTPYYKLSLLVEYIRRSGRWECRRPRPWELTGELIEALAVVLDHPDALRLAKPVEEITHRPNALGQNAACMTNLRANPVSSKSPYDRRCHQNLTPPAHVRKGLVSGTKCFAK